MISLFLFLIFFQTFNGNFDQNSVEKQILFSAFVARYLRFVVGSKHGGACLRVEVSGIPRRRGLIYCRNCSVFKEYSFYPVMWNLPSHHWKDLFPFCDNISSWTIIFFILFKNLVKIQSLQVLHCTTFHRKEVCNFAPKILYCWSYVDLLGI